VRGVSPLPETPQLVFASGAQWYAVPSERASEIVAVDQLTQVPAAPAHVLGVFVHRGEVIPLIDLVRLRTGTPGVASRAVVVRGERGAYALTVTRVLGVSAVGDSSTGMGEGGLLAHLRGPVRAEGAEVALVDVEGLFDFLKG
jgi:purine-binding chemotaxis protein CheW